MSFSLADKTQLYKDYDIANGKHLDGRAFGLTIYILTLFIQIRTLVNFQKGTVISAVRYTDKKSYAIKLSEKTDNFEEWKQWHIREIINAARISDTHDNVVKYYDAYAWTEVKYIFKTNNSLNFYLILLLTH